MNLHFLKIWIPESLFFVVFVFLKCIFVFVGGGVLYLVIFNAFIGFGVFFCIYEHILRRCYLHFWKLSWNVNNFRTNLFFICFDLLWFVAPPSPSPSLASVKVPFQGGNMGKMFLEFFMIIMERKGEKKHGRKWLRRVAFVGWDRQAAAVFFKCQDKF